MVLSAQKLSIQLSQIHGTFWIERKSPTASANECDNIIE